MTYLTALKHAGVNVTYSADEDCYYQTVGTTKNGKAFCLSRAAGAYGMKFTLFIDGKMMATACLFRTAIKLIKSN